MEEILLEAQLRKDIGKKATKAVRYEDAVPAVCYGAKEETRAIKVDRRTYEKILRTQAGQNVVFHLDIKDGDKEVEKLHAIVKEEQHDPVSDKILHIDFHHISLDEEIEVKVALEAVGDPIGVKQDGGSLDHVLWELDVVCLPTSIPEKISVDVSSLGIGDSVHVKDVALPAGVKTHHDPETIAFTVVPPMKEEGAEAAEEGLEEPEVIKEKKEKPEEKSEQESGQEKSE